uniref:Uncharacterized protein n=1 Tax=Oryza nivara TaxID=4536 RepID=A0A679BBS5_ORYNI|nr:hypothetical protein [Oryza sativa f. spontanea]
MLAPLDHWHLAAGSTAVAPPTGVTAGLHRATGASIPRWRRSQCGPFSVWQHGGHRVPENKEVVSNLRGLMGSR